jgi:hypothetical protein
METIKAQWASITAGMPDTTVKLIEYGLLGGTVITVGTWAYNRFFKRHHKISRRS